MTVQKIKSGRVVTVDADHFVGEKGTIFFNEDVGDLRLSNGYTLGGIPLAAGGSTTGNGYTGSVGYTGSQGAAGAVLGNLDGGTPTTNYSGIASIDAGGIF